MEANEWLKSTFSNGTGGNNCVEVRWIYGHDVMIRNSNKPNGHRVRFTPEEWKAFVEGVKAGQFDLP